MSEIVIAILVGIVEGLTEFLPVSSTAHIRLTQLALAIDPENGYWKMFAVVIQLGAILAVVGYFRRRLWEFAASLPQAFGSGKRFWHHPLVLVLISFVVTAVPCYWIDKQIGENLESLTVFGAALALGGVAMWVVDVICHRRSRVDRLENMTMLQAVVIGAFQILAAAFPGTSRSMATIAGGQLMGLSRSAALEFSFFLSIPVMLAATLFKLLQFVMKEPTAMDGQRWLVLAVGFGVSFIVAWAVIAWLMNWVRRRGFTPFAIYRIVVGLVVLWIALKRA